MFKKLLTALLIATACITYVCGIKLVGPAIYSNISHLYFFNSRDRKNTYICKGYGIIKNSNRGFYDCFLRNSVANYREMPVGAYLRDTQYKNPDKCYVDCDARVYDIVDKYCLTEYGWCWRG
ncbi:hypothetical protein H8356DRAFT_1703193 [Neocallimastix lanati (nom. inval.)]|uniref:Uncharacterized protein n=1 Tax=Neocallimastix californiae TaxID=1754190 RepID=A0A1Y2CH15_9FUNG|nr:hypothetical protein H8356DRAFT_1703193 [Neocallimastix sp. JGI-2020a]ORY46207.1 hypothetical protein LY90DRAFT_671412 [Neocallimastix californiae]|eukprot:ORY46207.1 hypothetical protein LY90DRAFT_671412 [Neocallimastix californiae]